MPLTPEQLFGGNDKTEEGIHLCRHCYVGQVRPGTFPNTPLTECPCCCHRINPCQVPH